MTDPQPKAARIIQFCIFSGVAVFAGFAFYLLSWSLRVEPGWLIIAQHQFATVVGLPMAALAAFILVISLKYSSGAIEFKILGFEFKGASGQIIMWIACYLAIVLSIHLLWNTNG